MEQRWYAGLPVVGSRELTSAELRGIAEVYRVVLWTVARNAALLIGAALLVVIVTNYSASAEWIGPLALGLTIAALRSLPRMRWYSILSALRIRRDLRAGYVEKCEGGGMRIEVLPHSALIWRLNDRPTDYPRFAHAAATAPPPAHAALAAQFVKPATDDGRVLMHQRALTPEEVAELDGLAPPMRLVNVVLAVVTLVGTIATSIVALRGDLPSLFAPFAFGLLAFWSTRGVVRAWRGRRRIAPDLRAGYVVIVRLREESGELSEAEEYLPGSRMLWTVSGAPAQWRMSLGRRASS
ncbi:MAG TPA: hypothetical protein VGR02_21215 [Thermoanaerobaculia bacterium]|jgi:hypothetical protein|nr:hypothetical protein [Thermoanaerobaculia bacterium]